MELINSKFYQKAKVWLDEYVANGGDVNQLNSKHEMYIFIKNGRIFDKDGNRIDVETKFKLLGHPRKCQVTKSAKEGLIKAVDEYIKQGGNLHITRKKLPFFEKLHSYTRNLKRNGQDVTSDQVMKQLGYTHYSDLYFKCRKLFTLKEFRDEDGYVDSYRRTALKSHITELSHTLEMPTYIIIYLLCDEKLRSFAISSNYIKMVETELKEYIAEHGTFNNIKRKNQSLYEKFNTLIKYYSDGTETSFSKPEWLAVFGLSDVEHGFKNIKKESIDIDNIMKKLKEEYAHKVIEIRNIDKKSYYYIVRKAVTMGISVPELFKLYGLKCNGLNIDRLSKVFITEVPYLEEMKAYRDKIIKESGISLKNGYTKEQVFEQKYFACKQTYEKFKHKLFNYNLEDNNITTNEN